jgi:hypothetical protein
MAEKNSDQWGLCNIYVAISKDSTQKHRPLILCQKYHFLQTAVKCTLHHAKKNSAQHRPAWINNE